MTQNNKKQTIIQTYILFFADLLGICLSYVLAILTRGIVKDYLRDTQYYQLVLFFAVILCLMSYLLFNLNERFFARNAVTEFIFVLRYDLLLCAGLGMFLFFTQKAQDFSRLAFAYFALYNLIFTYLFHMAARHFFTRVYLRSKNSSKMMVVTTKSCVDEILPRLKTATEWSHEITALALLDAEEALIGQEFHGVPVIADGQSLFDRINDRILDEIFIHLPGHGSRELENIIEQFELAGVTVHLNIDPFDHIIAHRTGGSFGDLTVLTYSVTDFDFHRLMLKRLVDILGSFFGMCITIILLPFIAAAIKIDSPGPVFYRQKRIGLNGREFHLYKFRSMYRDAEREKETLLSQNEMNGPMFKLSGDPRITRAGAFLRKTSLDEFPQFFNVFAGQMSLVGTRPPTPDEYARYEPKYRRRLSIKPGLTGLWQVSGRSNIQDFEDVLKLDLYYIDNWSLGLDIKILLQTLPAVLSGSGAK